MQGAALLTGLTAATMQGDDNAYGLIPDAAIAVGDGKILWVGPLSGCPADHLALPHHPHEGRLVTPALIDCHTHIVHGGHRAREFEMRLEGASYEDIARAGGGIISTVTATRDASLDDLIATALPRIDALIGEGVSTVEIKSGYGLDLETELNMLRAARALEQARAITVKTTFLGAHAVPAGMDADTYIDTICLPALDAAHGEGLVDAVDGFCEGIAFTPAQIARVFDRARALDLPVKLHAEQLSHLGGTALAAKYNALSADHIEYANESDAAAMAGAGTVAVLLPGAFYTLHETQMPPVDALRHHDVPIALATDWNPGSSPMGSLLLAMNMGCTLFGLTPAEALGSTTRNAALALGLTDRGTITPGQRADLAIWNVEHPAELSYRFGFNPLHQRIHEGTL
ncbi:imidazolonepropionase [Alisedimentitalea sp. MJ-SS2]|uniref:imidazolonepropionase n=1 Tax=Aliisedimentitalea sp. MJ-SS2 TaxID=3049795 RepID=UPI00290D3F08|nr:imidazolonepropionase [Alisedimentitalea sp. MJ-SS2]MDU8925850.1 imidazolonepropionase [Alisedimentitalea sp. MJ-SS2]